MFELIPIRVRPGRYSISIVSASENGLEDSAKLVKPVRTLVQHPQIQIDLRQGSEPDVGCHH